MPPVVVTAAGRGTPRKRSLPIGQCPAPSAEVQALFSQYGIDVQKVIQRYPHIANYGVQRVERMVSYLVSLGVDVKHVVEKTPRILSGQVEAYEAVVQLLRGNGVNVVQMVCSNPMVLTRPVTTLQLFFDAIAGSGHSATDVLRRYPSLLRSSAANMTATLQLLQRYQSATSSSLPLEDPRGLLLHSLGLDVDFLLKRAPQMLGMTFNKLNTGVVYLKSLGVDVPKVVRLAPRVLFRRPETLQERVQFLSENGLDALRHVNGYPTVLYHSIELKLQPTLVFVVKEMGRSISDLNRIPSVWGYDLDGRLRPRFLFLKSLSKSPSSLSQFISFPDDRFATIVAGADLQRYYDWRRRNGYPVPLSTVPSPAVTHSRAPPLLASDDSKEGTTG